MIAIIFKRTVIFLLFIAIIGCSDNRHENIPKEAMELKHSNVYILADEDDEGFARYREWNNEGILLVSRTEFKDHIVKKTYDPKTGKLAHVYEIKRRF
jgi:hypothetical protein